MANLGLGNRTTLKKYLLPGALAASASALVPDATIDALGLGVARQIERYCNRTFYRATGTVEEFSGDRFAYVLSRYPLEQVSLIEYKFSDLDSWATAVISTYLLSASNSSGLLQFAAILGSEWSKYRITYDGGYWFDSTEDGSGVLPSGAATLPEDLSLAWLELCAEHWKKRDKLGLALSGGGKHQVSQLRFDLALAGISIPMEISGMLDKHRRYQMS